MTHDDGWPSGCTRRRVIEAGAAFAILDGVRPGFAEASPLVLPTAPGVTTPPVAPMMNGAPRSLALDTRFTLLDAMREHPGLTRSKKSCDDRQCGACTVLVNGRRMRDYPLRLDMVLKGWEVAGRDQRRADRPVHAG